MPYSHRQTYQHKLAMNFNWPLEGTLLQNGFYFLFSFSISIRPPLPMFMASCLCFSQSSNSNRVFIPEMSFAKVFGKGYRLIVVVLTLSLSACSYNIKKKSKVCICQSRMKYGLLLQHILIIVNKLHMQ